MSKRRRSDFNPWEQTSEADPDSKSSEEDIYYFHHLFENKPKFTKFDENYDLDLDSKRAALKASPFVVALVSYSGELELSQGCGTIIEVDEDGMNVVITSANLIRRPTEEWFGQNSLADELKVVVFACDEKSYNGELCAYDFHYNLAMVKFKSDTSLSIAVIRPIDDCLIVGPSEEKSFQLRPHCVKLQPGDSVITVGRYFAKPYDLMAAPGCFSVDRCECDCKELFQVTCNITGCGDGSALVNHSGEMIGIIFYEVSTMTLCLPINIAKKWWDHYKIHRESRHPCLGFEASNLYVANLRFVDRVTRRFPSISKGVVVKKVMSGSSADSVGFQRDDIIVMCDGRTVGSFLELWEAMFDKVGKSVEMVVARFDSGSFLNLNMLVVEATLDKLNSWPQWR